MSKLKPRYLTKAQVAKRFTVTTRTIEIWVKKKKFPPPIHFSRKCVRWPATSITAYERRMLTKNKKRRRVSK